MTDDRMDALIAQLDVDVEPDRSFVEATLARLFPVARDARRLDASPLGRVATAVGRARPGLSWRGRSVPTPLMFAVATALLLATIGLVAIGASLVHQPDAPSSISYVGSFETVHIGSGGPTTGVVIDGGRVLVHSFGLYDGVRVWDPADGKERDAGTLRVARYEPAFVPLHDGRVLVVGGDAKGSTDGWSAIPATAEVFDPASGISQAVGPLVAPRAAFATSLLPDGRVLISGGYDPASAGNGESTAEIFDPATGMFSATGSMEVARWDHHSLTLPDGRVLLWGGIGLAGSPEVHPETFDPATGVFSPAASMGDSTYPGVAVVVLVDGRLLLFPDRCDDRLDHPTPAGHQVANVEFYDPAAGASLSAGQLPNCVDTATALPNGEVLVTGTWWDLASKHIQTTEQGSFRGGPAGAEMQIGWSALFDPDTGKARETAPIVNDGPARTVLLPDGTVLFLDFREPRLFR